MMLKDDVFYNFRKSGFATLLAGGFLIPFLNHFSDHSITIESVSMLVVVWTFMSYIPHQSLLRTSLKSITFGIIVLIFVPIALEYTPPSLLEPFVRFPYGNNLYQGLESKIYMELRAYNNLDLKEIHDIVASCREPVVFRGAIADSQSIGGTIIERLESRNETFLSQRFQTRPYDFFRGSRFESSLKSSVTDVLRSLHNEYIGFEPLLVENEIIQIMNSTKDIVADHSFISNFNDTIVTTFVHAAPAGMSWAVQLIGKKTWFFWDPSLAQSINAGWFPRVSVPSLGDESTLFSNPCYRVTVGPGDIVVFPPLWYHTVVTHAGPNLMINMRTRFGHWIPKSLLQSARFFIATILTQWVGQSTPHHMPGIRKIRMNDLQRVFDISPETMRWDNPEKYTT